MFISKAIFFLLLIYFHNLSTNEARSFPNTNNNNIINLSRQFSEAPNYRNAQHCPTLDKNDMSYSLSCNPSAIHIAMTIDSQYLRGSIASVNSILTHSSCPDNLFFHFIASEDSYYTNTLKSTFPSLHFKLYIFDESKVNALISSSIRKALDTPLNYARSYLAELLDTCVSRVIYLDSDTIVVDDIAELWAAAGSSSRAVAAPEYCGANFARYFTDEFWSDPELSEALKGKKACYFNTGVMVVDLGQWRERDYTEKIESWMRIQKERRIYDLGSLPPFLLVFGGEVERIDHRWNQHGLGGDNVVNSCRSLHEGPVSLMHWSGKGKPWVRLDSGQPCPVDFLWAPYDLYRH